MNKTNVYREVKNWKIPVHKSKTLLAKSYLKLLPQLEIIGITGSVGKTLTQNAIYSVLSQKFKVAVGSENLDPTFRIPKTILSLKPWYQKLILEYGVEQPGEMDHYLKIVKPNIAVVTAISPTHLKYFKNTEGVFQEKAKLIKALSRSGHAVLDAGDPYSLKMAHLTRAKTWFYGSKAAKGIKISHFAQNTSGSKFRFHYQGDKASVAWKIVGYHQLTSAYAAATVGIICGLTLKQVAKGLTKTKPPAHRLNVITHKNLIILDDTYNSSPKAAIESIKTLIDLGKNKQKIAVLGEMRDLGAKSQEAHTALGQFIAKTRINYLLTIGSVAATCGISARKAKFSGRVISCKNTKEAARIIKKLTSRKSLVLVKGSRHEHLERVVYALLGKSTHVACYHCGTLS